MTSASPPSSAHGPAPDALGEHAAHRHIVLLGAGLAHLDLVLRLAQQPLPSDVRVVWIAPSPQVFFAPLLPDWVSGRCAIEACTIALDTLAPQAGVRCVYSSPVDLDVRNQQVRTADGAVYPYNWLSINLGAEHTPDTWGTLLPGAAQFGIPVYPLESFALQWNSLCERAQGQALRIAVIGHDTIALELALAVRTRLPKSAVTLVLQTQPNTPPLRPPPPMEARLRRALKSQGVTVLEDTVVHLTERDLALGCGAHLACDVALVALRTGLPRWLTQSGLHSNGGHIQTDAYLRSQSHPHVFVASDGEHTGTHNVVAAATGTRLRTAMPAVHALQLGYGGAGQGIAHWGGRSAAGRVWHWLRQWHHRQAMARYRKPAP